VGSLLGAVVILDTILQQVSAFLYGDPSALGHVFAGLVALFTTLWLFGWGITRQSLQAIFIDLGLTYLGMLLLVQISVWISAGALWGMAKLLPMFRFSERYAPLLLERRLGLYTWISLGVVPFGVGAFLSTIARRKLNTRKAARTRSHP
jgi:hypothetical protein